MKDREELRQMTATEAEQYRKEQALKEQPMFGGRIIVDVGSFDYLIGKLFTHTELLGLPERQHIAYKATVRTMFWDWYNSHMENEMGLSDPSRQYRLESGIEKQ